MWEKLLRKRIVGGPLWKREKEKRINRAWAHILFSLSFIIEGPTESSFLSLSCEQMGLLSFHSFVWAHLMLTRMKGKITSVKGKFLWTICSFFLFSSFSYKKTMKKKEQWDRPSELFFRPLMGPLTWWNPRALIFFFSFLKINFF